MDEVITSSRCDKGTQTLSPYLHVQRLDLGKRRLEPPLAPKRLKQNPRRVQTTLFCGCLDIILSWPWATMDSLFNPPIRLPPSVHYKSRAQKPVDSFYSETWKTSNSTGRRLLHKHYRFDDGTPTLTTIPMRCRGLKIFSILNLPTWTMNLWSKRLPKGKAPLSKPYGLSMPSPNCIFWCTRLGDAMERKT
ncbi:hypothetical protein TNCV_2990991 [Trichonephila clavipes]|nr:hypothetical protein TNCV_2990991 [Trichonephila clavipes]